MLNALHAEFFGTSGNDAGSPARQDGDLNASSLEQFDAKAVANIEGFKQFTFVRKNDAAVREHAVDVKHNETDFGCAWIECHNLDYLGFH